MSRNAAELDLGREALISLAAKLTMSGFGFLGVVVFAYVLGPVGVGRYYFPLAIALTLVRVSAGVGEAIKKRVSEVDTAPEEYLGLGLLFHGGYLIIAGIILTGAHLVLGFYSSTPTIPVGVFGVFASVGLFQILNRFYQGIGHPGTSYWVDTARSVLTTGFQLFFLLLLDFGPFGLLLGLTFATIIASIAVSLLAGIRPELPQEHTAYRLYEFAAWSVPSAVVQDFYKRLDVILLGVLAGEAAVGFYETALRLVLPATQLAGSVSNPLNVKASGRSSIGESIRADLANVFTYTGLFAIPMFFGAVALPAALMRTFFSTAFSDAAGALVGIAAFTLFNVYQSPLQAAVEGTDRPEYVFRIKIGGLLLHAPLAIGLTLKYGLFGVVVATLVAEIAMLLAYEYLCRDFFGGVVFPTPVIAQIVSGVVMFLSLSLIKPLVPLTTWYIVVGLVVSGALIYFSTLAIFSAHFRLTLRNVVGPQIRILT